MAGKKYLLFLIVLKEERVVFMKVQYKVYQTEP